MKFSQGEVEVVSDERTQGWSARRYTNFYDRFLHRKFINSLFYDKKYSSEKEHEVQVFHSRRKRKLSGFEVRH